MLYALLGTALLTGLFLFTRDGDSDPVPGPFWVRAPQAEGYYTGVGIAALQGDKARALRRAEEQARGNLAQSVWAEVSSQVESQIEEQGGAYWERFSSRVQVKSTLAIPAAVVADRWYDPVGKTHYCYVKVPVAVVHTAQGANQRQIEAYISAEKGQLKQLDRAAAMQQFVRRQVELIEYMRQQYQGGLVAPDYRLQLGQQMRVLYGELADVLASVEWTADPIAPVPALVPVELALAVRASYGGRPLANVPVGAAWAQGFGLVGPQTTSDGAGQLAVELYQINSIGPDNALDLRAQVYALVPDSLWSAYPEAPHYRLGLASYDPKTAVACYIAGVEGAGYVGLDPLRGRLAGFLGRSGFRVMEAESLAAGQNPPAEKAGVWVALSARLLGRAKPQGPWPTEAQWHVYRGEGEQELCRSGTVRQVVQAPSQAAYEEAVQKTLYTKMRGSIADAVSTCMGL